MFFYTVIFIVHPFSGELTEQGGVQVSCWFILQWLILIQIRLHCCEIIKIIVLNKGIARTGSATWPSCNKTLVNLLWSREKASTLPFNTVQSAVFAADWLQLTDWSDSFKIVGYIFSIFSSPLKQWPCFMCLCAQAIHWSATWFGSSIHIKTNASATGCMYNSKVIPSCRSEYKWNEQVMVKTDRDEIIIKKPQNALPIIHLTRLLKWTTSISFHNRCSACISTS